MCIYVELSAFLSTPNFIKSLTDVSNTLSELKATKEEKHAILKKELARINEHLPASVYIPFVNSEYIILMLIGILIGM